MKAAITVVIVAVVFLLLAIGANYVGQFADIGYTLKNAPRVVADFMAKAYEDYRFWTVVIIGGVLAALYLVNGVPTVKTRR